MLRLRAEVFVVEQECAYLDLDGRDCEPGTHHLWLAPEGGDPLAYLRILADPDGLRIGRVATAAAARRTGLADRLLRAALERTGDRTVRLHAQAHLRAFYGRYGFRAVGAEFLEDSIPHVPMIRP